MGTLEAECFDHGLRGCMDCYQSVILQKMQQEGAEYEKNRLQQNHSHSTSWDSSNTLQGDLAISSRQLEDTFSALAISPDTQEVVDAAGKSNAPALNSFNALMYGPKYVLDRYKHANPASHSALIPASAARFFDHPYARQTAVVPTKAGVKTHCAFFLRTGHCDFAQQGCKFSHELPPGGIGELSGQATDRLFTPRRFLESTRDSLSKEAHTGEMAVRRAGTRGLQRHIGEYVGTRRLSKATRDVSRAMVANGEGLNTDTYRARTARFFQPTEILASSRMNNHETEAGLNSNNPNMIWRDVENWRNINVGQEASETDGAADDEDSASDLISLSSGNYDRRPIHSNRL